ncbi:hypothetical protein PILCRDRAFT_810281 [Piloderma croceum F 1598]|uniref:Uncharacterized protein n=1 Tax=Piloderma croceum (strain F 1598) TaxID=765440 RepID=A0A0C3G7N9_PILCF|nr:hypothetical protein PILCRDRAFT_810281 [Piloderma croceum F 1598]
MPKTPKSTSPSPLLNKSQDSTGKSIGYAFLITCISRLQGLERKIHWDTSTSPARQHILRDRPYSNSVTILQSSGMVLELLGYQTRSSRSPSICIPALKRKVTLYSNASVMCSLCTIIKYRVSSG